MIRQAHHSAPLSHRWLSGVEDIPLGTLIYCCSLTVNQEMVADLSSSSKILPVVTFLQTVGNLKV
jgi:hypothetical protein